MKFSVIRILAFITMVLLLLVGCNNDDDDKNRLLSGIWLLGYVKTYTDSPSGNCIEKTCDFKNYIITITISNSQIGKTDSTIHYPSFDAMMRQNQFKSVEFDYSGFIKVAVYSKNDEWIPIEVYKYHIINDTIYVINEQKEIVYGVISDKYKQTITRTECIRVESNNGELTSIYFVYNLVKL